MFDEFANFPALLAAANRSAKGKRHKPGAAAFLANLEPQLLRIADQLQQEVWLPGPYKVLHIEQPKPRMVSAAPFPDRVVHQALCAVIGPVFERGFISDSFANQKGKGSHRCVDRYTEYAKRYPYVLRCDIFRYFPAIDHAVLKADLRRKIKCVKTRRVLDAIIDGSNPQEPVDHFFPGDDLFTVAQRRRGLPIGNQTSQLFGNVYLNAMDHFVKEVLRVPGYVRYVDDFALFHSSKEHLQQCQEHLAQFLTRRRLLLHPRKTYISATTEPAEFLGYVVYPSHRLLSPSNVTQFRRKLLALRQRWCHGAVDEEKVRQQIQAWVAHAKHANTWRLRYALLGGGWFSPELVG